MTITGMLNTALSGIFTSQSAMRTTAQNIANVNTEGYQRQVVKLENNVAGGLSSGVKIAAVERIIDRFLQAAGFNAASDANAATVQREIQDRFQGILGRPDSSTTLAARLDFVFSSFADLTLNPSDRILRQASLGAIDDMNIEIGRLAQSVQELRNDVSQRISEEIITVNAALKRIQNLNPIIIREQAQGSESAGLKSQRDIAITEVAKIIDVTIVDQANGSITLQTASGAVLVDNSVRELEYLAPGIVSAGTRFSPIQIFRLDNRTGQRVGSGTDLNSDIRSGALRGLLDLRDGDLRDLSLSLGQLASTYIEEVNRVHNTYTSFPPANKLTGQVTGVAGGQTTNFTGKTTFAITDANGLLVRKTTVDFTGAPPASFTALITQVNAGLAGDGTLALTNGVMTLTATNGANGALISDDATAPGRRAGMGFSQFFGMNDLLEATIEGNFKTGFSGTEAHNLVAGGAANIEVRDANGSLLTSYTMNVVGTSFNDLMADLNATGALGKFLTFSLDSNGEMLVTEKTGFSGLRVDVVSDTTNVNNSGKTFTALFGIGDRNRIEASKDITIRSDIAADADKMSLLSFDNTVAIGIASISSGDQTGALAFQNIQSNLLTFSAAGQLAKMNVTLAQFSSAFLANAGLMAARAENREEDNSALLIEIDRRQSDVSGVNLDEELANMIVLQNSFNAAARLLTTADEMLQALIAAI
jgi:flagellar hook-associated protein 1